VQVLLTTKEALLVKIGFEIGFFGGESKWKTA